MFLKLRMRPGKVKKDKTPKSLLEVLPFNLLCFRGGHYNLGSVFYVLFCFSPSSFSMSHRSNPQIGLVVMSLASALHLLIQGNMFSR